MKGLNSLGWQIHDHLKKYRPKMFQDLKAQGRLKQIVETMQNQASQDMASLEAQGLYHHEAWEIVKDDVLPCRARRTCRIRGRRGGLMTIRSELAACY